MLNSACVSRTPKAHPSYRLQSCFSGVVMQCFGKTLHGHKVQQVKIRQNIRALLRDISYSSDLVQPALQSYSTFQKSIPSKKRAVPTGRFAVLQETFVKFLNSGEVPNCF